MNAVEEMKKVKESAEKIKNDEPQRFPEAASNGDAFRQGDIYITKISGVLASKHRLVDQPAAQLAPGTTRGSRHILDSLDGVELYIVKDADALTGPLVVTLKERVVTHPEHGDVILPPGCYAITYQRAYADELRRVAD
tara:strand:- start:8310 stop:8723 length:414 start_codon:yes stop_codon:yes gene_type:complete